MTGQELSDLKARMWQAHHYHWKVGKANEVAEELAAMGATMPKGVEAPTALHLLKMIEQIEGGAPAPKPVVSPPKPKAEPPMVKVEPKVEAPPPPAPKAEEPPQVESHEAGDEDLAEMLNVLGNQEIKTS
jgi:hypothetical protein